MPLTARLRRKQAAPNNAQGGGVLGLRHIGFLAGYLERGLRTLEIVRKGSKHVIIPLAPRTSRALDLYIGERTTGPIFLGAKGGWMDRYAADRTVKRLAHRAGIAKRISPRSLRRSLISAAVSTPGSSFATSRRRPATRIPARPCAATGAVDHSTGTPSTSWRRSWLALSR